MQKKKKRKKNDELPIASGKVQNLPIWFPMEWKNNFHKKSLAPL